MVVHEVNSGVRPVSTEPAAAMERVSPLRVLHLNPGNLYGGVETVLATLATMRGLCPAMEPHFGICYEGRSSQELKNAGVAVHALGPVRISRPWTVWGARRRLQELLQKESFDLVVCHMSWTLVVFGPTARAAGLPVALWAHGFPTKENWLERLSRYVVPDLVIANSCFTANHVRKQYPKTAVEVVYCPLPLTDFAEPDSARDLLRKELGVDERTVVILQVSRLEPWKGHLVHLHALSLLDPAASWVCWMVGGPQTEEQQQYLDRLHATANKLGISGRVRFLGQRSDVPKLLVAADIFCQPNEGPEPFGLVFVEALWSARPVVTTALGGALEIVDESCGLLAKPGDPVGLAETLSRLIASSGLRQQLGHAGPARAQWLCDPLSRMNQFRGLAQDVVNGAKPTTLRA